MRKYIYNIGIALATLLVMGSCGKKAEDKKEAAAAQQSLAVDKGLHDRLVKFENKPRCKGKLAMYVYDITAHKPLYGYNERLAIPSASCLKVVTAVAGMHLLGTDYRWSTTIFTRGQVVADTLRGDIGFFGRFDPQLRADDMDRFADALRRKGIKAVSGKVVLDLAMTDKIKSEEHWYPWDLAFSQYGVLYKGKNEVQRRLREALQRKGIRVKDSQFCLGRITHQYHGVLRIYRTLDPVLQKMLKNSSNPQATSLLCTIGRKANPKGDPSAEGVRYLRRFVSQELGYKDSAIVIHDGCGLCTYNHLSPKLLAVALTYAYERPAMRAMMMKNLSVSGVDGTLRRGIPSAEMRGKIHGKTGTLSHPYGISSVAGYCQGANGHQLAFAIMASEMSVLDAHVLQRDFCKILASPN